MSKHVRFLWQALILVALTGCGSTLAQPTAISLPPTSAIYPTIATSPTPLTDKIWKEQAVGASKVSVTFYNDPMPCIRYQVQASAPVEKCATRNNLVATQGITTDSAGKTYTIIVGRVLTDKITAVSLEMPGGDNAPAEVTDGGFLVILSGQHHAVRAVPIDQYGNLVGDIFAFG